MKRINSITHENSAEKMMECLPTFPPTLNASFESIDRQVLKVQAKKVLSKQ